MNDVYVFVCFSLELDRIIVCLKCCNKYFDIFVAYRPEKCHDKMCYDIQWLIQLEAFQSTPLHVNLSKASDQDIITARNSICGKVMFSEACIGHSSHWGGSASGSLGCGRTHTRTPALDTHTLDTHTHPWTPPGTHTPMDTPHTHGELAGGTHPTRMLSCQWIRCIYIIIKLTSFS